MPPLRGSFVQDLGNAIRRATLKRVLERLGYSQSVPLGRGGPKAFEVRVAGPQNAMTVCLGAGLCSLLFKLNPSVNPLKTGLEPVLSKTRFARICAFLHATACNGVHSKFAAKKHVRHSDVRSPVVAANESKISMKYDNVVEGE
ncbi:MAG: hypothetical protein L0Y58_15530, partial [Verrucomicrobia subdivision 3 bacterium]|nr:hypothetical protein [Limisphaerales bacterium]